METFKNKQKEVISTYMYLRKWRDILPTGYGKILCYVLLPYVFDHLRRKKDKVFNCDLRYGAQTAAVPP